MGFSILHSLETDAEPVPDKTDMQFVYLFLQVKSLFFYKHKTFLNTRVDCISLYKKILDNLILILTEAHWMPLTAWNRSCESMRVGIVIMEYVHVT